MGSSCEFACLAYVRKPMPVCVPVSVNTSPSSSGVHGEHMACWGESFSNYLLNGFIVHIHMGGGFKPMLYLVDAHHFLFHVFTCLRPVLASSLALDPHRVSGVPCLSAGHDGLSQLYWKLHGCNEGEMVVLLRVEVKFAINIT